MEDNSRNLLKKLVNNNLTKQEHDILSAQAKDDVFLKEAISGYTLHGKKDYSSFLAEIESRTTKKSKKTISILNWRTLAAAAVIAGIIFTTLLILPSKSNEIESFSENVAVPNESQPPAEIQSKPTDPPITKDGKIKPPEEITPTSEVEKPIEKQPSAPESSLVQKQKEDKKQVISKPAISNEVSRPRTTLNNAITKKEEPILKEEKSTISINKPLDIKGQIQSASNLPLRDVTIENTTTKTKVKSDNRGVFTLLGKKGDIIEFTKEGFKTKRLTLENDSFLSISLENK